MKIFLTRPRYKTHIITPPLGLGYLAGYLKKQKVDCTIIDGLKLNLSNEEIVRECQEADIVGISVLSSYFLEGIELSLKLKKVGKIVIIGGPHATCLPDLTLKKTKADFVILGEGERVFYQLIKDLEAGKKYDKIKIRGVFSKTNNSTSLSETIANLSSLPIPDWTQIDPNTYPKAPHGGLIKNFPVAPIVTSRGCPYSCRFCSAPFLWQRKIRFRRPREVIKEIKYLVENFQVKEIHLEDDNFTLKRAHAVALCKGIIREKLQISLATPNGIRADRIDHELLRLMKKAGFYYLAFGVESGNKEILKNITKKTNLETIKKAVNLADKMGFLTQGFFIFGLPGETRKTVRETLNLAKNLPLDRAQFLLLDILPGTALWDELNFAKKVNWSLESFHEVSWLPPTIDRETLSQAQSKAFREFYLRPKQIISLIKLLRPEQIPFLIKRVLDYKVFTKI